MEETLDLMLVELRLRGYSAGTKTGYLSAARRFLAHVDVEVEQVEAAHLRDYMLFLEDSGYKASTRRMYLAALKFLFVVTLKRQQVVLGLPCPKTYVTLPQILSRTEVLRVIEQMTSLRCRMAALTIYATGLRISEVCALCPEDIDSKRMLIRVRAGKGNRDRFVMLSRELLRRLRAYWVVQRPSAPFLFPSIRALDRPMTKTALRNALRRAASAAGVNKPVSPHVLRHCFATHMLELGADIRQIQLLLGHRSIKATTRYTQLSKRSIAAMKSPLDVTAEEADLLG